MHVTLIRHGQTPSNVLGLLDTAPPGAALTPRGMRQAAAIPPALAARLVDGIFVSPLLRTSLTAAPLAAVRGLTPMLLPGLSEIAAGDLEMRGDETSVHTYLGTAFEWARGDLNRRMPGGETGHAFFARFDGALSEVEESGAEHAVIVSHGAAIRTWASARLRGADRAMIERTSFPNTGSVEFEGAASTGWDLVAWNAVPVGGSVPGSGADHDPTGEPVPE